MKEDLRAALYKEHKLSIEGISNIRQLGGYIGANGLTIKKDVLLRGGHLSTVTDEGIRLLSKKYNVNAVIDFRTEDERNIKPDKYIEGAESYWLPIITPNENVGNIKNTIEQMYSNGDMFLNTIIDYAQSRSALTLYKGFLSDESAQRNFGKFFRILINANGAVFWHCTQGKDRTGIAAALLLFALGADRKTVIDDYELSLEFYKQEVAYIQHEMQDRGYSEESIKNAKSLIGVDRDYMEQALKFLEKEYGSVHDYLNNQLGVSDDDLKILRYKYL